MENHWKDIIEKDIQQNEIMVYMRGNPQAPRCGFSARVVRVLKELDRPFETRDMDSDPDLWSTLKELNQWPTSPQIFIRGEFIGGCDIFVEMFQNGELQEKLGIQQQNPS